ncbi:hypothetical protein RN001_012849 [Aquatica leii]|uniref:Uncharacterized protein n=1 Tax=Aquatica leii TaxID=1421715 RepID=A0AAN7PUV2_9COLE|nr:hypothetical protein RN001_012849 [Aquatica leii]
MVSLSLCEKTHRKTNKIEITEINKTIRKKIREDMRKYRNTKMKETLKEKESLKELRSKMNEGKHQMTKLIDEENKSQASKN